MPSVRIQKNLLHYLCEEPLQFMRMPELSVELQLNTLPESPGVYQFYDKEGKMLYVGKAKNLKKRVTSYFTKTHDNGKTRVMVRKIRSIRHIVVPTESDALLLENNLIKKYQPRYNVLLKDDFLLPPADDLETYVEFVAVYLELRYFAPRDLHGYFPRFAIGSKLTGW